MFQRTKVGAAAALAVSGLALTAIPSYAQQQQLERVEITGSSLRRVDAETALPVTVIQVEDLAKQGVTNAEQALQRIAANQTGNGFSISGAVGATTGGKTEADVRGLSSPFGTNANKTLVLLNGRRLPNHGFDAAAVDLNAIPLAAISRIEVLRDGASAIYGTDAIGGVINFILRRDYQGVEVSAETIQPRRKGGGDTNRASITAGFGSLTENRFNIVGSLDFRKQKVLLAKDRDFAATGILFGDVVSGTSGTSFPGDITANGVTFEPSLPNCAPPSSIPNPAGTACRYDFTRDIDIIPENETLTGLVRGSFAITPEHTLSAELLYATQEGVQKVAPAPNNYLMPASSPFYPAAAPVGSIPAANPGNPNDNTPCGFDNCVPGGTVNFRLVPGGKRTSGSENTTHRALIELQGALAGWDYRTAIGSAKNKATASVIRGYLLDNVIQQGLYDGLVNPFGDQTAAGQQVFTNATARGDTLIGSFKMDFVDFRVTKDLFQLPAGPVASAFGVDFRKEKFDYVATDITAELGSLGIDSESDTKGDRDVKALFAEFNIPIIRNLDLTLAARYDDYSDFGSTTNPKVGLRWQPIPQVLLRGSYNTGFRAPTLFEIYQPASLTFTTDNYDDPVLCPGGVPVPGAAPGVVCGQQVLQRQGGPAGIGQPVTALDPEESKTVTFGIVFEPTQAITIGVDYWRINVKDLISPFPEQSVFGDPVAQAAKFTRCSQLSPIAGPGIDRTDVDVCLQQGFDPIAFIDGINENLGELKTSGIDLSFAWRSGALPIGNIGVTLDGTYITKYDYQRERGGAFIDALGRYSDNAPVFRWQHALQVNWTRGPWGATLAQRHKSGYRDQDPARRVSSYELYDLSASYTGIKNLTLTAGVLNLFDKEPPISVQVTTFQRGFDPRFTDPLQRSLLFRAAYKFF